MSDKMPSAPPAPPAPPAFGTTQYSYGAPVATATSIDGNVDATRAMQFALASFLCGVIFGPLALGFGIKGYKAADLYGGEGRGKALFGIVIGALDLALIGLFVLVLLSGSASSAG